jgi:hypothetical protein
MPEHAAERIRRGRRRGPDRSPHLGALVGPGPPLERAARCLPATRHGQVGGARTTPLPFRTGATMLVIGDAAGHDAPPAATMAQTRLLGVGAGAGSTTSYLSARATRCSSTTTDSSRGGTGRSTTSPCWPSASRTDASSAGGPAVPGHVHWCRLCLPDGRRRRHDVASTEPGTSRPAVPTPDHRRTSAPRSSRSTGAAFSYSPHSSRGSIHMTSNSLPSGSTP